LIKESIINLLFFCFSSQSSALEWHLEGRTDLRMPLSSLQGVAQSHGKVSVIGILEAIPNS